MPTAYPVLITGSSSGIGLAIAVHLASQGYRVLATMRDPARQGRLAEAARAAGVSVDVLALDVTRPESIEACASEVHARHGRLGALINNAGIGIGGFFEDQSDAEVREQLETNFFGALATTRAFVPPMREARSGVIVNVTSLNGRVATPGLSAYAASKFALEGFSEALRHELRPFGVRVALVEPGMFRTEIFASNLRLCKSRQEGRPSAYREMGDRMLEQVLGQVERRAAHPRKIAHTVAGILADPDPGLRYPVGTDALLAISMRWLLPERLFHWMLVRAMGL